MCFHSLLNGWFQYIFIWNIMYSIGDHELRSYSTLALVLSRLSCINLIIIYKLASCFYICTFCFEGAWFWTIWLTQCNTRYYLKTKSVSLSNNLKTVWLDQTSQWALGSHLNWVTDTVYVTGFCCWLSRNQRSKYIDSSWFHL